MTQRSWVAAHITGDEGASRASRFTRKPVLLLDLLDYALTIPLMPINHQAYERRGKHINRTRQRSGQHWQRWCTIPLRFRLRQTQIHIEAVSRLLSSR